MTLRLSFQFCGPLMMALLAAVPAAGSGCSAAGTDVRGGAGGNAGQGAAAGSAAGGAGGSTTGGSQGAGTGGAATAGAGGIGAGDAGGAGDASSMDAIDARVADSANVTVDAGGDAQTGSDARVGAITDASNDGGARRDASSPSSGDASIPPGDAGAPPPLTGPVTAGTVTVTRATTMGRLPPSFLGFSFEKSHMSDTFFTPEHTALVAMLKLLGPGVVRIGADDVNISVWQPNAPSVTRLGTTSPNLGTAQVDALAGFLTASGWKTIYSLNMRAASSPQTAVAEATYVVPKLGSNLIAIEIGNELNLYGAIGTIRPLWHSYSAALHAAFPNLVVAGPGVFQDITYAIPFIQTEASEIGLVTHHYYRGTAGTAVATLANLVSPDPTMVSQSQQLAAAVTAARIAGGYRWGEMNSYSSHGQPGASDVLASALWGINFMLTTAQYGSAGVNFHGGGQNMDGNVCPTNAASCDRPFRYSPILEIDSRVSAAAPLYYGMLLVAQAGTGPMLATRATAGNLSFSAYTITPADGSTRVVLVNSDANNGINAAVDIGVPATSASAIYLRGPSLTALTGTTLAGAPVSSQGAWNPNPAYTLATSGTVVNVPVPPASAVLVYVK